MHHIDGDNRNHERENLAFLCFACHDRATKIGGLSSKLPTHAVREYRDHWHDVVRARREAERRGPLIPTKEGEADWRGLILDMLAVMEVRKTAILTEEEWDSDDGRIRKIRSLFPYTFTYGLDVRSAVLEAVHDLAGPWSWRTPRQLAEAMAEIIEDALPVGEHGEATPLTPPEQQLFDRGARLAMDIASNAGRYMEDLCAVQAACRVLEKVLRRAFLSGDAEGVESMKAGFTNTMADSFGDGREWMRFAIANALRPAGTADLEPPEDLHERLWKCRETPSPVLQPRPADPKA